MYYSLYIYWEKNDSDCDNKDDRSLPIRKSHRSRIFLEIHSCRDALCYRRGDPTLAELNEKNTSTPPANSFSSFHHPHDNCGPNVARRTVTAREWLYCYCAPRGKVFF